jgi:hypothetical protein
MVSSGRPRDTPIWKLEAALKCRSCRKGAIRAARAHDPAHAREEIAAYVWVHSDDDR